MFNTKKGYTERSYLQLLLFCSVLFFGLVGVTHANIEVDWYEQFGGVGGDDISDLDSDGNTYVVGSTASTLPGETNVGLTDAFIRKYDSSGDVVWTDQFGTSQNDRAVSVSVNGSYVVVVGVTDGALSGQTSIGNRDMFIRTYEHDGTLVTTKQVGTTQNDEVKAVSLSDNYLYLSGYTSGVLSGQTSSGGIDVIVQKYHVLGSLEWSRQFGTAATDQALGVSYTPTGVYVLGSTNGSLSGFTNAGSADMFVRKYDTNGNELWTDQFGTSGYDLIFDAAEEGSFVYVVGDVEAALPGQSYVGNGDAFVRKYNAATGAETWTREFGTAGLDEAYAVETDTEGVYVTGFVEGALSGQTYTGEYDVYVRKYDFSGNELYSNQLGTVGGEDVLGLSVVDGYLYLGGRVDAAWPGATNAGGDDAYLVKFAIDSDGDGIFDAVDTDVSNVSTEFDDGNTTGTVVTNGDQTLTIKDAADTADGVYVVAASGGGVTPATIFACGISTFYLDAGDTLTITCGSVTFDVFNGEVEVVLTADDGRVAESTVGSGNAVTFEATDGSVTVPVTNSNDVVLTAGNETVVLAPGTTDEMPSDMPITVDVVTVTPAAIPVGGSATIAATVSSPIDEVSTIVGMQYTIDSGTTVSMVASDGVYDETTEDGSILIGPFTEPGVYEVCVTGSDSVANVSENGCTILAVYDPNGGYVTGGGQIDSPAGAYTADPTAVGKAHFGFISEYENGAQVPTGNTQFRFKAGDLSFKSTSYDWLVVAGSRAQYKGYGEINKQGGYRFMLTAVDGDLLGQGNADDKFRMKIWNDVTGGVVYDNQLNAGDAANLTTVITHGNIVIHDE